MQEPEANMRHQGKHYIRLFLTLLLTIAAAAPQLHAADCSRTSTGFTPLSELGSGTHQGKTGGLYPGGANARPAAHDAAGMALAAEVVPRNQQGQPASGGKIVLLSIGMSNTTQEFRAFQEAAALDSSLNPDLVIVDGAQGGQSADRIVADGAQFWQVVDQRLRASDVTPAQVQVVWMKQATARPTGSFPDDAIRLQRDLETLTRTLKQRFPQLRLLYLSNRTYAGYASTNLNPEPYAYQSGFAVKWLIEDQIQGKPELDLKSGQAPWLSWGPDLWADGLKARQDGLTWSCDEFNNDGTHPARGGREKVARMLLDFFKSDGTTRTWFLKPRNTTVGPPQPTVLTNAATSAPPVAPRSIATLYGTDLAAAEGGAGSLPLPRNMVGVTVEVNGEPVGLYYVSGRQINLLLPLLTTPGTLRVYRDGVASAPLAFDLRLPRPPYLPWIGTRLPQRPPFMPMGALSIRKAQPNLEKSSCSSAPASGPSRIVSWPPPLFRNCASTASLRSFPTPAPPPPCPAWINITSRSRLG